MRYAPPAGCNTGISPAAEDSFPLTRTQDRELNRGLGRPVMQAWCSRNHVSGKAKRKVYTSWCHSPGETYLNKLEKP
jgi:hypothetical protein